MKGQNMKTIKSIRLLLMALFFTNCQSNPVQSPSAQTVADQKIKHIRASDQSRQALLNIPYRALNTSKKVTTFGFGSCNDQSQPQPLWKSIYNKKFDLFLMMGDNVYASHSSQKPIIDQYIKLNENADYKGLRESTPFLATWDDHDYGVNDGGADSAEKADAKKAFLNYWGYLRYSLPLDQEPVYHSRIVGDKKNRVQFIMLDTRWDRSPLVKNPDYNPNAASTPASTDATAASADNTTVATKAFSVPKIYLPTSDKKTRILSEAQWNWLESELRKPAELRILVSSFQLIANDHYFEKWGNFPHERERFFKLLQKTKTKNLVILSGDRHLSAIAKYDLEKIGPVYEITSSGLNKPSRATELEVDSTYIAPSFLKINYGQAQIDWDKKTVQFDIVDIDDKVQLSQTINF
jgi:alkaline phosphatase D